MFPPLDSVPAPAWRTLLAVLGAVTASISLGAQATRDISISADTSIAMRSHGTDTRYSVTTADGRSSGWRVRDDMVRLRWAAFDPLEGQPAAALAPESGRVRLVQFETMVLDDYVQALSALGVDVLRVVPPQTVVAEVPAASERRLAESDFVRWVGPFPAEARLDPRLVADLARASGGAASYVVQVARRGLGDKRQVARAVRAFGGTAEPLSPSGFLLRATLTPRQLVAVAGLDQVVWIERAAEPTLAVDLVRQDSGANAVEVRTGYSGAGVRGEVLDTGLAVNHPEFQRNPPILHGPNTAQVRHGTGVYGIVFSTGEGLAEARGLLPDGQGISASFYRLEDRYNHTANLLQAPYRAVFQTNSWGNGPSPPGYPSLSFEMDDILHQHDLLVCQAFGNSGRRIAFRQAWAKNLVTVGGVQHFGTLDPSDDGWNGRATIGPATDGRIKPDLAYWNERIQTTIPPATYSQRFGGTSAATPQVAGVFGLFFQMWHEEVFGNVAPGSDVFDSRPSAAAARAFVYNTAVSYAFQGTSHDLTRTHQGWGRPNAEALLDLGDRVLVVDQTHPLQNFEVASYAVRVGADQRRLRATLAYLDPAGTSAADQHRINDLSLRVTSPDGVVFWGNVGLAEDNASDPGGSANTVDTVEQVWVPRPMAGIWKVEVIASELLQDTLLTTPEVDATFGLVVAPVEPVQRDVGRSVAGHGRPAPTLEARGSFVVNSPWRFDVSGAVPGQECLLLLTPHPVDEAVLRGTELPALDRALRVIVDDRGEASFAGVMAASSGGRAIFGELDPRHLTGEVFYVQALLRDAHGVTATNALEVHWPEG